MRSLLIALCLLLVSETRAHVGSPNVYFEGSAGSYPVRVIIKPPGVVPGLADIHVRALGPGVERVSVLPVFWDTGRKGAPPPDRAEPVRGETKLFHAMLWLMSEGAYSVNILVEGDRGNGAAVVPVNSVPTTRNPMPGWFGIMLSALGLLLFASAARLAGAAFGESVIPPGEPISRRRKWIGRAATLLGAVVFALLLAGGRAWWNLADRAYVSQRLFKPSTVAASVGIEQDEPILDLRIVPGDQHRWKPLLSDHGKLMHLFLVRKPELDAFAHLHPAQDGKLRFRTALPPLPAGEYAVYADVSHEDGLAETATGTVSLPEASSAYKLLWQANGTNDVVCSPAFLLSSQTRLPMPPDPDDSWQTGIPGKYRLPGGHRIEWVNAGQPLTANRETTLQFRLQSPDGQTLQVQPYMGMLGHAAVLREDGSVFSHLHPGGTYSMAAQQFFAGRDQSSALQITNHPAEAHPPGSAISFPYEFPKEGPYRLWVQMLSHSNIFTGIFDADVTASK